MTDFTLTDWIVTAVGVALIALTWWQWQKRND